MDNLTYLMKAYFHEDWPLHQSSWQDVVDAFLTDDPVTVRAVPDEIDALLSDPRTSNDLADEMAALGCSYDPADGYRAWLQSVRDRIRNADQPRKRP